MTNNIQYSYLDPTYPAYYCYFNRPKTILCFSLRRFILILTIYDIILSSIAVTLGCIYLLIDRLNHIELFQSNKFFQTLTYLPIGIIYNDRILFKPSWTINTTLENFHMIIYSNIILNSCLLICSINMLTAIKYHKPYRALIYFVCKTTYVINVTTIFIAWIVNPVENYDSIRIFYGNGDIGFFTPNMNIFCFGVLECLWKSFSIMMIFRSIQYIRDYCLHQELNSIKKLNHEYQSSTQWIIHVIPNNLIINKQYNV